MSEEKPLAERLDNRKKSLNAALFEIKHKFMMMPKWNSLQEIADIQELFIRKDGKICVDIVEIQGIIGEALGDYVDLLREVLERELK